MAEGGVRLRFQVLDEKSGKKFMLQFNDYSTFEQKCKQKFGYSPDAGVVFVLEDDQDIELDESAFECFDNDTKFRMRRRLSLTTNSDYAEAVDTTYDLNTQSKGIVVSTSPKDKKESTKITENTSDACENNRDIENASDWCSPEVEKITSGADYIREEMEKRGKDKLVDILREAKNLPLAPLNICVTGSSGQGKSKLINTLRNLSPGDDGYAPVGTTETTEKCTGYPHPHYQNIIFWDVPGVGTICCPKKEYLSKIDFAKYDFFLICSSTRFTEDDALLANEVKTQKKRFYFLRTKVDQDIDNAYRELQDNFDEKVELVKIKQDCHKNVGCDIPVFLISSIRKTEYEFPSLYKRLIEEAPVEQQRSLIYGLVSVSEGMIESKAKYLKAEIWKTALLSGVGGAVPIPGLSCCIDVGLIIKRLKEYRRQFQLTPSDMKTYANMVSLPEDIFIRDVRLAIDFALIFSPQGSKFVMSTFTIDAIAEETSRYVPVIGTAFAAGFSYWATGRILHIFLDGIKNDAKRVLTFVARKQATVT